MVLPVKSLSYDCRIQTLWSKTIFAKELLSFFLLPNLFTHTIVTSSRGWHSRGLDRTFTFVWTQYRNVGTQNVLSLVSTIKSRIRFQNSVRSEPLKAGILISNSVRSERPLKWCCPRPVGRRPTNLEIGLGAKASEITTFPFHNFLPCKML
jgi:hypothetical protein